MERENSRKAKKGQVKTSDRHCTMQAWKEPGGPTAFDGLMAHFPADVQDLSALAQQTNAVTRWRKIKTGRQLLQLLLLYALQNMSLATIAASAVHLGIHLTSDALRYRFQQSHRFLNALIAAQLSSEPYSEKKGLRLRLQDASTLQRPGTKGTDWRFHAVFDFEQHRFVYFEITDSHGPESLKRTPETEEFASLYVADRGLGHARQIHLISKKENAECLVRVYLPNIKLFDREGQRIEIDKKLQEADAGRYDSDVMVPHPEDRKCTVPARLLLIPLSEEGANRARQKVRKAARKKKKAPHKPTLKLAGYLTMVTTLKREDASVSACAAFYRCRWSIELFFKRSKSILGLGTLTRSNDPLSRTQILSKILMAALVQGHLVVESFHSSWQVGACLPASIWKQTVLLYQALKFLIIPASIVDLLDEIPEPILLRLRERPRKRRTLAETYADIVLQLSKTPETLAIP